MRLNWDWTETHETKPKPNRDMWDWAEINEILDTKILISMFAKMQSPQGSLPETSIWMQIFHFLHTICQTGTVEIDIHETVKRRVKLDLDKVGWTETRLRQNGQNQTETNLDKASQWWVFFFIYHSLKHYFYLLNFCVSSSSIMQLFEC